MKYFILFSFLLVSKVSVSQNTFPASGNVGIGTNTPSSALSVKGRLGIRADATPTTPTETMRVEGAITSEENVMNVTNMADQDFIVRLSGSGAGIKRTIIGPSTATRFSLGVGVSNGNEYLTLVNGGNVGIGATTPGIWFPAKTLEVSDTRPVLKLTSTAPTGLSTIAFTNSSVNPTSHNGEFHLNYQYDQANNDKSLLRFSAYPGGETLTLLANGNVGIGTTPGSSYKFDVNGTINAAGILINGVPFAGGGSQWTTSGANIYYSAGGKVGIGTSAPQSMLDIQSDPGVSALRVQGGHPYDTYYMDITPYLQSSPWTVGYSFNLKSSDGNWNNVMSFIGGKVGIGNTNPDAMLTVTGQVHAQEVKVTVNAPGPDYVFEKDYKLTSLEEIKNYIDQNKHLPEVPSAKEMEKNGVQLGEMNMLLLKKIEELTLYVIELKRENTELKEYKNQIDQLRSDLNKLMSASK